MDWCDIDMRRIRRKNTFEISRDQIQEHFEQCMEDSGYCKTGSCKWESIGITTTAHGVTLAMDDAEEYYAVMQVAMLASTWFNAAVACLPGTASQHGYDEQWNIEGKAYVTGVFAA